MAKKETESLNDPLKFQRVLQHDPRIQGSFGTAAGVTSAALGKDLCLKKVTPTTGSSKIDSYVSPPTYALYLLYTIRI